MYNTRTKKMALQYVKIRLTQFIIHTHVCAKTQVVQKDCQVRNLNREDAMDRGRWKKLIKIG